MLSKSELKLLSDIGAGVGKPVSIHEVAQRLDWSDSYASRVVSQLRDRGYIETDRERTKKHVTVTDIQPVERLGALTSEFGHVDFPELIAGAGLKIIYYLDQPRTASEIAELSRVSRGTVYRRLNDLQRVGIVGKTHSEYELTEPFSELATFARAVAHHEHRQEALAQTAKVNIVWECHDEYLFSCESEATGEAFHRTGPAVFEEFGITLLTRERFHYFRSDTLSEITATDLLCHMLLIDEGTRYRTYCLLLLASHDISESRLKERTNYYNNHADRDLTALTMQLRRYLDSRGEDTDEQLPVWEEFKSTATDYDISV